jgi:lysophospholipase L1-like esterase
MVLPNSVVQDDRLAAANILGTGETQGAMRAIVAAVRGGQRKIMTVNGDSTEAGFTLSSRSKAPTAVAAAMLQASGLETRADGWFGNGNIDAAGFNPNWIPGPGMALRSSGFLGQKCYTTVAGDGAGTVTPDKVADRFDVYTAQLAGTGTLIFKDGAITLATANSNGTIGVRKTTIGRPAATLDPITIQHQGSGGTAYILGVVPWNSKLGELNMINCAASGALANSIAADAAPYLAKATLDALAPHMMFMEFGLNDIKTNVPLATFLTNMTVNITQQQARGGAVSVGISCSADPSSGYDLRPDWLIGIRSLARANGLTAVDFNTLFGPYARNTAQYSDVVHMNDDGASRKGRLLREFVFA